MIRDIAIGCLVWAGFAALVLLPVVAALASLWGQGLGLNS